MIDLVDVTKSYGGPDDPGAVSVLRGITLHVERGQSLAIVGPSGCGKSTLLNIIGGLDHPTSGRVVLDGRNLAELADNELARIRSREIGFVFQLHHLLPQCTVLENVLVPTLAGRNDASPRELRVRAESLRTAPESRCGKGPHQWAEAAAGRRADRVTG
jgi:lipoprotein-releasing system ATP-binding protein